jgi:PTS system N-acetylglucosamine-specific IIC component
VRAALGGGATVWAAHGRLLMDSAARPDLDALTAHGLRRGALLGSRWHLLFEPSQVEAWRSVSSTSSPL